MQRPITRGAAANAGLIFHIFAQDSTSTTGAGKASIAFGSWTCYYIRNGEAISGAITTQDITTIGTYAAPSANTNIRIKAVDNTNMIGIYEVQIHSDWVNTTNTCQSLTIYLSASGVAVLPIQIPLWADDMQSAKPANLSLLSIDASGRVDISKILGTAISTPATAGVLDVNVKNMNNVAASSITTVNANVGTTQPVNFTGTGASALAKSDVVDIAGAAVSTTTAQVGTNVVQINGQTATAGAGVTFPASIASPTNITAGTITTATNVTNVNDKTGYALSTGGVQAVWDALTSALTTSGSIGKWILDKLDVVLSTIKAKTDNLPSDPADASDIAASFSTVNSTLATIAGYIDTEVAAIKAKTDNLPSDPADASDIAASFASIASTLSTIAGYIDTEVAAIKAKTDNLPASPAVAGGQMDLVDAPNATAITAIQSGLALQSLLTTVAGYIDTEVSAIKAKTDNLPSDPADASDIATSFSSVSSTLTTIAGYIDTEVAAIKAKTDNLPADPAGVSDIPTSADNASAYLDLADGVETGLTPRQAFRLMAAAAAGKLSGAATTTIVIRNAAADSKNRITATCDADGNRSAITLDLT